MSTYSQCRICEAFLITPDSDNLSRASHARKCLESCSIETGGAEVDKHRLYNLDMGELPFTHVKFDQAQVNLIKLQEQRDPEELPATATRPKRVRKRRYPDSDFEDFSGRTEIIDETDCETKKRRRVRKPRHQNHDKSHSESTEHLLTPQKRDKTRARKSRASNPSQLAVRRYRFSCDKCTAKFYSKHEMNVHMNIHTGHRTQMSCLICLRIFNKRDSLNNHITAHLTAEEMEEKWKGNFKPVAQNPSVFTRLRIVCKHCLLVNPSHKSFMEHVKTEHNNGERIIFPCRSYRCSKQFDKIRELIAHAKSEHPKWYHGKMTYNRMTENGLVKNKDKIDGGQTETIIKDSSTSTRQTNRKQSKPKRRKKRRKKSASDEEDGDEEDMWLEDLLRGKGNLLNRTKCQESNVNVELERVNITDDANGVTVERECSPNNFSSSVIKTEKLDVPSNEQSWTESEAIPIALEIKRELL